MTEDGKKRIDLLLQENTTDNSGSFLVLEFKRKRVDVGAVEQLERYCTNVEKRLYSKKKASGFLVAQEFSQFEVQMATQFGHKCVRYSPATGLMDVMN